MCCRQGDISRIMKPKGHEGGTSKIKNFVVYFHPCKNNRLQATKIMAKIEA